MQWIGRAPTVAEKLNQHRAGLTVAFYVSRRVKGVSGPSGRAKARRYARVNLAYANHGRTGLLGAPTFACCGMRRSSAAANWQVEAGYEYSKRVCWPSDGLAILLRSLDERTGEANLRGSRWMS